MNSRRDFLFSMTKYVAFGVVMMKLPTVAKSFEPDGAELNFSQTPMLRQDWTVVCDMTPNQYKEFCRAGVGGPRARLKSERIGFNS